MTDRKGADRTGRHDRECDREKGKGEEEEEEAAAAS